MTFAPSRRTCAALAIGAYLVVALFAMRNALYAPSTRLAYPATIGSKLQLVLLDHYDQAMVVATVTRNAHLLVTRPWDLLADFGQCYPMPSAHTLGEHMFGVGLLAALPYALTRDPILSYNVAVVLTLWIPGVTMYFLARRFTRNPAAAFVAGLAFALVPGRLIDPSHPYVHGDLWAPAALLFLHRLFIAARWRDALGLALFLTLEIAESLYPLIATCLVMGVYGLYVLLRHRANVARVLPRLAVALGIVLMGVWIVLVPYLETGSTWGLLAGRASGLLGVRDFLRGGDYFPGYLVLALALVALLDRLRGPRIVEGEDPRLAFLAAGLVVAWSALRRTAIPGLGVALESPFLFLRGIVPGLEAVRALAAVALGTNIATSFLCAYGVVALTERLRPRAWAPTAGAVACALALLSLRFVPSLAHASFGRTFRLTTYDARPAQADIDLLRAAGRGPVLDYPLGTSHHQEKRLDVADSLLLASYDPRPMAACYNSFLSPVNEQLIRLAGQIPAPAALEALHAIGLETVLLTKGRLPAVAAEALREGLAGDPEIQRRLQPLGETARLETYRIQGSTPVETSFALLGPAESSEPIEALMPTARLELPITNRGSITYRHPAPLRPSDLVLRWTKTGGDVALESATRALLPIALGPGGQLSIVIDTPTPSVPGDYVVTLARAAEPARVLARRDVRLPALDSVMPPADAALRLNQKFFDEQLLPLGLQSLTSSDDEVEMLLGPGVSTAAELRARGHVAAHWLSYDGKRETMLVEADVRPTGISRRIVARLPVPPGEGAWLVLLTPPGDPGALLAGRAVFVGRPRPASTPATAPNVAP